MSTPHKTVLGDIDTVGEPMLLARVGSWAYGLAKEDSDVDLLGVYKADLMEVLSISLFQPTQTLHKTSDYVDYTAHELGKFVHLALKANPTVLELLFLEEYLFTSEEGGVLLDNKELFLSQRVRDTYGGYAKEQIIRLRKREAEGKEGFSAKNSKRRSKHARHCFRLLGQGVNLLEKGTIQVRVDNPSELFSVGEMETDELEAMFDREYQRIMNMDSVLPPHPDYEAVNQMLLELRFPMIKLPGGA